MKHCLVFASLISPSKMILFEKKYQTFDTVFHHQMKHLEVRQKYSAARRIFNSLLGVSSGDETLHLMFDILRQKRWYSVWACSWHEHLRLHVQNWHPRVWSCKSNNGESHTRSGFTAKKVRIRTWLWPSYELELLSSQPSVFTLYPSGRCIRIMDIRRRGSVFVSHT